MSNSLTPLSGCFCEVCEEARAATELTTGSLKIDPVFINADWIVNVMNDSTTDTRRNVTQELIRSLRSHEEESPADRHIAADLERRAEVGVETYGEELHTNNGRDALRDLYEELLDAYQYAYQHRIEGGPQSYVGRLYDLLSLVINEFESRDEREGFLDD